MLVGGCCCYSTTSRSPMPTKRRASWVAVVAEPEAPFYVLPNHRLLARPSYVPKFPTEFLVAF